MARSARWKDFPWEGVLVDLLLIAFWSWALPPASAWCLAWPHVAVWALVLLQSLAVGRMVSLYLAGSDSRLLGKLSPLGGLAAVLSVGGFIWLLGAMFSSKIEWGFFTLRMPLVLVFTTLGALGIQLGNAEQERTSLARARDAALVVLYLFAAEAFLFAMVDGADVAHRRGLVVGLVLCHLPMRLVFASVQPTQSLRAALCGGRLRVSAEGRRRVNRQGRASLKEAVGKEMAALLASRQPLGFEGKDPGWGAKVSQRVPKVDADATRVRVWRSSSRVNFEYALV